jgi:Lrp/AsnC family transcriptional regulator, leucine-responsive regulatory protein
VTECHRITGEDCFLVRVHAPSLPELEQILDRFLMFGQTSTSIVVSTPVPPRALPLVPGAPARRRPASRAGSSRAAKGKDGRA